MRIIRFLAAFIGVILAILTSIFLLDALSTLFSEKASESVRGFLTGFVQIIFLLTIAMGAWHLSRE